jgi:hypothetical protein
MSRIAVTDHTVPYGTVLSVALYQALRARLRSRCPSGTKYILRADIASLLLFTENDLNGGPKGD